MADDLYSGEKSEPATPRKREQSREKGQVARSQDLTTATLLLASFLVIYFLGGGIVRELVGLELLTFEGLGEARITLDGVAAVTGRGLGLLLRLLLPLAVMLLLVGLAVNVAQVGFMVTGHPISPDLNRLNPLKGFGRIFSRRGVMRLLFGIFKLGIVGFVLVQGFRQLLSLEGEESLFALMNMPLWGVVDYSQSALFTLGVRASGTLLVLALFDLAFQRWQHSKDLMMTKQEVRDELRRMEGDPLLKERRRGMQRKLALQRMMSDVKSADVVITNPTHVACAIRYREKEMNAPRLLAKGRGSVAHRIRETAVEHAVPVVQEPPLARLIHDTTEVGDEIPADLYKPVAEVLAYVFRLEGRTTAASRDEEIDSR